MDTESIKNLIKKFSESAEQKPKTFLNHIDYFKGKDNNISASSISENWTNLTGENSLSTYAKGYVTIRQVNCSEKSKGCPFKYKFSSQEVMEGAKHPCDTGIVNEEGSINFEKLEFVMTMYFEICNESPEDSKLVLRQSRLNEYLEECSKRDKDLPQYGAFYIPYKSIARAEWDVFFPIFSDVKIDKELCITAETFLLFYFNSRKLYDRVLDNKKLEEFGK